ncbi:hypothetical protein EST38_g3427 [Candolleomyces aberdarensis]|uniref:PBP domain-containing protein n=1 Tax=Candolleomyces aberdarensis TaxID=2316362 RepID=A0A4Q2DPX9_9AGAR|nr:hypothetical protein EST38_g3427 [Candolleomyces aberdarensis]
MTLFPDSAQDVARGGIPKLAIDIDVTQSPILQTEVYDGGYANAPLRLRIASGGAGESGLIAAWAEAFIHYMVDERQYEPFSIGWYLGDTTESLAYLEAGTVDVAITYNEAAEFQSIATGAATRSVYGFRDHFVLVGPKSNPAKLKPEDDILMMFRKIVIQGNADSLNPPDPTVRPPARFLSRFDKSATNIKESELFIKIGQVPWGLPYSTWYHQYPQYPQDALQAAALLSEYTLTAPYALLASPSNTAKNLEIFKAGGDDPDDLLLNPAHVLLGAKANPEDIAVGMAFLDWVNDSLGGRKVVKEFKKNGQVLYSEPPL